MFCLLNSNQCQNADHNFSKPKMISPNLFCLTKHSKYIFKWSWKHNILGIFYLKNDYQGSSSFYASTKIQYNQHKIGKDVSSNFRESPIWWRHHIGLSKILNLQWWKIVRKSIFAWYIQHKLKLKSFLSRLGLFQVNFLEGQTDYNLITYIVNPFEFRF